MAHAVSKTRAFLICQMNALARVPKGRAVIKLGICCVPIYVNWCTLKMPKLRVQEPFAKAHMNRRHK
jgi:hypothetical protein